MPNPIQVPLTPPRVPVLDERTGTISREWYMFFLSLRQGIASSSISLDDLQKWPPAVSVDEINENINTKTADLAPSNEALYSLVAELTKQIEALAVQSCTCNNTELQKQLDSLALTPPPQNQLSWYNVINQPRIEAYETASGIALSSTPMLLKPSYVASGANGITYTAATGEFTFSNAGSYSLALHINAMASSANQFVYLYAENDTGSGWTVNTNSGKTFELTNANMVQIVYAQAVSRVAGQKVRYWIYSNDGKIVLNTYALPGGVGAIVPAIRIQYS